MHKYAIWGTSTSPSHEAWVRAVGKAFEADGFELVDDHADADFVLNMFDADDPKAFRRSSRGTYSASFYELDAVPDDVLRTSYPNLVRTLANVVVLHVPGQGVWFTTMEQGTYKISDDPAEVFERLVAAREVEARDRQRVRPGPGAGALGRGRDHGGRQRCREADGRARPPAGAVPGARVPERARPPSRDAPLPGRRPLLRQPVRAQGRHAVLDERVRRRQDGARGAGPRHPARDGLRRGEREHADQRRARDRAAPCLGRRDRALDDLPGASRCRRHPPRACMDGGHRRHRHQLPLRNAGAGRVGRRPDRPRAGSGPCRDRASQPRHHRDRRHA